MIWDRSKGIWAQLKSGVTRRMRRPTDDAVGNVVRFDRMDVLTPLEDQGDGLYLADAHDAVAKHRAAFSQHICS